MTTASPMQYQWVEKASGGWLTLPATVHDYYLLLFRHDASGESAILNIWGRGSDSIEFPLLLADTLAEAKLVTMSAGTAKLGTYYTTVVALLRGVARDLYIEESTPPNDTEGTNYWYLLGALLR